MNLTFLNLSLLAGLAAVAIPVAIHFWNRRRADVVAWGAMMFLPTSPAQRRRIRIEDLVLLLIRCFVIAMLAAAAAVPIVSSTWAAAWMRPARDVVFVLDANARLTRRDVEPSPWAKALDSLEAEIAELTPADRWAVALATRPIRIEDLRWHRGGESLDRTPLFAIGNTSGPAAVERAADFLASSSDRPHREIVILSDGLRDGWVDEPALAVWERLKPKLGEGERAIALRYRTVAPPLKSPPKNAWLAPIERSRSLVGVGRPVTFTIRGRDLPDTALVSVLIDDERIAETKVTPTDPDARFTQTFRRPGPHRVRFEMALDPRQDAIVEDNRRETIIDVRRDLPIVVIDGDETLSPESPAYYLMEMFRHDGIVSDRPSLVVPRRVPASTFQPSDLAGASVVVLADIPTLAPTLDAALDRFVRDGGGVLVLLGTRTKKDNRVRGWMPCEVDQLVRPKEPISLDDTSLAHPALRLFQKDGKSSLTGVRFGGYWKVRPNATASVVARFTDGSPWLLDRPLDRGRVIVSTAPFDRSWNGTLTTIWEFPVLVHELIDALAAANARTFNLAPGDPVHAGPGLFSPEWRTPPLPLGGTRQREGGVVRPLLVPSWPELLDPLGPAGAYTLTLGDRPPLPFVVEEELRLDWTPLTDTDRSRLDRIVPISWDAPATMSPGERELGRAAFVVLLVLLLLECWLAGRIARAG